MDKRRENVSNSALVVLVVLLGGGGCFREGADQTHFVRPAETARELIFGFAANDPAYDAIGSISWLYSDDSGTHGSAELTGALIGPRAILTVKNDSGFHSDPDNKLVFTIGPDANKPTAYYEIVDHEDAPGNTGGYSGRGHDISVMYIDDAPPGIRPIGLGSLSAQDVGEEFAAAGFGARDSAQRKGQRRIGGLDLKAVEGRTFEAMFGSFAEFYEGYGGPLPPECVAYDEDGGISVRPTASVDGSDVDCSRVQAVHELWESQRLETVGELVAGGDEGDAQPCVGDWGAPLLRADQDANLIAYGIVSGLQYGSSQFCERGAVFAGLGEEVMAFLERAKDWVDPCGDVTWQGQCTGSLAQRCTNPDEGERRIVSFDCALAGEGCYVQPDGMLGCGIGDGAFIPEIMNPVR